MQCVVLAGGVPQPHQPLFEEARGAAKALIEIGGRPMVQWVLDALADSGVVDGVVLVGLPAAAPVTFAGRLERLPSRGSLAHNLYAGIESLLASEPGVSRAAFCWSDIPLATGPMIRRFVERAQGEARDAHVVAGLVRRSDLEGRYPAVREQWLRTLEGRFVAADFGLFDPTRAEPMRQPLEILTDRRKSAVRQASAVGFPLLVRYLLGRLTLPRLERTLATRYGVRSRVLVVDDPELGLDVDGPQNLTICRDQLAAGLV